MLNKSFTLTLAAVVLVGASLVAVGDAYAKGGKGGGKGGHGYRFHHHIISAPVVASSCWKWIETRRFGLIKVNICH
jgi:hypothetical protein